MKSRMTLRMGKMLEARTAPGNQQRTAAKKEREKTEGRRRWRGGGGTGCDSVFTRRGEKSQRGIKMKEGGNGSGERGDERSDEHVK